MCIRYKVKTGFFLLFLKFLIRTEKQHIFYNMTIITSIYTSISLHLSSILYIYERSVLVVMNWLPVMKYLLNKFFLPHNIIRLIIVNIFIVLRSIHLCQQTIVANVQL
jgi:hypothetical protein